LIHPHQEEAGSKDCGLPPQRHHPVRLRRLRVLTGAVRRGRRRREPCGVLDRSGDGARRLWPFTGDCVGEYMDGMAMEWDDGRSCCSFYPS
jgi:hypothetical protein